MTTLALVVTLFAVPGVKLPSLQTLSEVVHGGDEVEIERVARRIGESRLARAALSGSLAERLAALRALPLVEGAWASLAALSVVLADENEAVAREASRAVLRIADALTPERAFCEEIPSDVPQSAARALWSVAGQEHVRAEARGAAIAAATTLRRQLRLAAAYLDDALLDRLLSDGSPTVRRAAVESLGPLAPAAAGARPAVTARLEHALLDEDPGVAAAAGVALCAGVPPTVSRLPAEQSATSLAEPARARVRALVADEKLGLADQLDLIPCLRAFGARADHQLLDGLAHSTIDSVKRRARAYGGR